MNRSTREEAPDEGRGKGGSRAEEFSPWGIVGYCTLNLAGLLFVTSHFTAAAPSRADHIEHCPCKAACGALCAASAPCSPACERELDTDALMALSIMIAGVVAQAPAAPPPSPESPPPVDHRCEWSGKNTGTDDLLKCRDGSYCNVVTDGWNCCACRGNHPSHQGIAVCPKNYPYMCNDHTCGGGSDCENERSL